MQPFSLTQEKPLLMVREGNYSGNDRFEGYAKDLADLISEYLNINCKYLILFFFFSHSFRSLCPLISLPMAGFSFQLHRHCLRLGVYRFSIYRSLGKTKFTCDFDRESVNWVSN